jgi:hypothetical protein
MRRIKTLASALVVALVVIVSLDYTASAATGHPFILGKLNKANKVTALKRTTAGPALQLTTTSASDAPLATNGTGKVTNLNADLLDGRDASTFATNNPVRILEFNDSTVGISHTFSVGSLPAGRYLATYSVYLDGTYATAGTPTVWGQCYFQQTSSTGLITQSITTTGTSVFSASGTPQITLSGAGPIDTAAGANPSLVCSSNKAWRTRAGAFPYVSTPATISLTTLESPSVSTQ